MKQKFHPDAIEEYLGAVAYYADFSPKLGKSFIEAIESGVCRPCGTGLGCV